MTKADHAKGRGRGRRKGWVMLGFLFVVRGFVGAFRRVRRNPETRSLPTVASTVLLTGTAFYWQVEGWSILDSLYFSVTTLTTLGLGDLKPTSDGSKVFTIVYLLVGIGVLVAFVTALGHQLVATQDEKSQDPPPGQPA